MNSLFSSYKNYTLLPQDETIIDIYTNNKNNNNKNKNYKKESGDTNTIYISDFIWLHIFSYVKDSKTLANLTGVNSKFYYLLTHPQNDDLWNSAYINIQNAYLTLLASEEKEEVRVLCYDDKTANISRLQRNYLRVQAVGQTIFSFLQASNNRILKMQLKGQRKATKAKKLTANLVFCILVFYSFLFLLGLKLDNIIPIPMWSLYLPISILLFYFSTVISVSAFCSSFKSDFRGIPKVMQKIFRFRKPFTVGLFCFFICLICLSFLSFISLTTGKQFNWIWIFVGITFLCIIYIIFTFSCNVKTIKNRYGPSFRIISAVSLVQYCVSLSLIIYTQTHLDTITNEEPLNSWAEWMLITSYGQMIFYLQVIAIFNYRYFRSKKENFFLGNMELLTAGTVFLSTALGYCKVLYITNLLWSEVFIPVYITPLLLVFLCYQYVEYSHA